jgi:CO dehydrogenase maturation factor
MPKGIKIAVSGKGGVGKTTLAAALAWTYKEAGYRVMAVDADPDANLATAMGVEAAKAARITPISELKMEIAERTGSQPGTMGGFFSLNPKVDDLPEKYCLEVEGMKLMSLGTIDNPGAGCVCPESALLRRLIQHLVVERDEAVILDMEAGIEHLGRATAQAVDLLLIVIEPGSRSVQTANKIAQLGGSLGIPHLAIVMNKVEAGFDSTVLQKALPELPFLGKISRRPELSAVDIEGRPVWTSSGLMAEVRPIWDSVQGLIQKAPLG